MQHGTWASEQEILKMIETGNLDYRKHQDRLGLSGNVGKMSNEDTMRQFKNQVIAFTVLASRAAIRSELSPETAYTLSDFYLRNAEAYSSLKEVAAVSFSMQENFVQRFHNHKLQNGLSAQIGYSQNHLCQKFKAEHGIPIRNYINLGKSIMPRDY